MIIFNIPDSRDCYDCMVVLVARGDVGLARLFARALLDALERAGYRRPWWLSLEWLANVVAVAGLNKEMNS